MESFLRHINQLVHRSEEQESLVAAARRIGPYDVLEPSSEEVQKVRQGRGKEAQNKQGPQGNRRSRGLAEKGRRGHRGAVRITPPT